MKEILLTLSALAIGTVAASAADLPARTYTKAPPPPLPPVFSWTGFYVGENAGYAWGHFDPVTSLFCPAGSLSFSCAYALPPNLAVVDHALTGSLSPNGFTGGLQAGYNWQFNSVVAGIETDFNAFLLSKSLVAAGHFPVASTNFLVSASAQTDWLYTLRGRLGWTVTPTALVYATGGLAVTDLRVSNTFADNFAPPVVGASSSRSTKAGWTVGGGVEWAFDQNWRFKAEYLYADFGSVGTTLVTNQIGGVAGPNFMSTTTNLRVNIVRVGVNYAFGSPDVARY